MKKIICILCSLLLCSCSSNKTITNEIETEKVDFNGITIDIPTDFSLATEVFFDDAMSKAYCSYDKENNIDGMILLSWNTDFFDVEIDQKTIMESFVKSNLSGCDSCKLIESNLNELISTYLEKVNDDNQIERYVLISPKGSDGLLTLEFIDYDDKYEETFKKIASSINFDHFSSSIETSKAEEKPVDDDSSISKQEETNNDVISYSGTGDKIITGISIPYGEYKATINIDSTSHYAVKFYPSESSDDYELLINDSGIPYSGTVLIKDGEIDSVESGTLDITAKGPWTIDIEKITESENFPFSGVRDSITGLFDGTGTRNIVNINIDSTDHYAVKVYKYNGQSYDYDLLVNDSGEPYNGQQMFKTEKGEKYFFVIKTTGTWEITQD